MSKSKGNIIDPLEMIDKYGADALRFTLAAFTAQGRDVRMSEERIQGYRFFVNKIWNAARFCLMNLEDYPEEEVTLEADDYSICDRWIKDRLNQTVADLTRFLDEYRFNDAAGRLYQFIWHEFCDWYLELVKPVLYSTDSPQSKLAAQHTLLTVLKSSIQLLNPFMPFVTEEIWQQLPKCEGTVMESKFPSEDEILRDGDAVKQMSIIMDVITRIRNIRGEMNIPPSKKLKVILSIPDEQLIAILKNGKDYVIDMANLQELSVEGEVKEEPKGVATGIAGSIKVYVFLEGMIDIAAEIARLEKEMNKVTRDLGIVSKKLANQDFRKKASETVIQKEILKSKELKEKGIILENALNKLYQLEG